MFFHVLIFPHLVGHGKKLRVLSADPIIWSLSTLKLNLSRADVSALIASEYCKTREHIPFGVQTYQNSGQRVGYRALLKQLADNFS